MAIERAMSKFEQEGNFVGTEKKLLWNLTIIYEFESYNENYMISKL